MDSNPAIAGDNISGACRRAPYGGGSKIVLDLYSIPGVGNGGSTRRVCSNEVPLNR